MNIEHEKRLKEVVRLLRDCTDQKLLKGGTAPARSAAEKAHKLATEAPRLPAPWPQLAAYRLAHLILRCEPGEEELHRADVLLGEASQLDGKPEDVLGPMPRLYRLAIIHRLDPGGRRATEGFEKAVESVLPRLSKVRGDRGTPPQNRVRGPLQDGLLNMLELAVYFLGIPYPEQLKGREDQFSDLMLGPDSWQLIGHNPRIGGVRMPHDLALIGLEARGRAHPGALLFRLSRKKSDWRIAGVCDWTEANEDQIRLLANLVEKGGPISTDELRPLIVARDEHERFRQVKSRLNQRFKQISGTRITLLPESSRHSQEHNINPDVVVFGVVQEGSLNWRLPRNQHRA